MHDIDLAILGATPERFDQYEEQIRQEYIQVPWKMFCMGQATILRKFLEQPMLYDSPIFQQKFEQIARASKFGALID